MDSRKLGGTAHELLFEPWLLSHGCSEPFILNPECGAHGGEVCLEYALLST